MKPVTVRKNKSAKPIEPRPIDGITGTEHDFDANRVEDWEDRVIRNASHFTVSRKVGIGKTETHRHRDFVAAINDAFRDPRAMVYAVCDSGRAVMVVRGPNMENWKRWYRTLSERT